MARPRVFISSTFYDLKQVRNELERFVKEMGYEPVLNERGHIPYGKDEPLEEYCYREVQGVDMLVSIVGGRFGSESLHKGKSISQIELEAALKHNKQVYIFILRAVHAEYDTYIVNKATKEMKWGHVNDRRVYEHLEEILSLQINKQAAPFELASDITFYLKEQWAGLFQHLLQDSTKRAELSVISELKASVATVNQLAKYMTDERKNADEAVRRILTLNHPFFEQLKTLLEVPYRLVFMNRAELIEWLGVRGYKPLEAKEWDTPDYEEYLRRTPHRDKEKSGFHLLRIKTDTVFEPDGTLKPRTAAEWNKIWVIHEWRKSNPALPQDDAPFDDFDASSSDGSSDTNAGRGNDDIPF